ncbi:MAG: ABC transporter substrate-binding protein [Hyphomicrobium sp.]|nr:MAG: ABC transporter substrate-binding protein [Hyphomicrobium sp.]PPD01352.1 MAG: ABC transporter substrate-binding protein [Hyphomicrobium sp.]
MITMNVLRALGILMAGMSFANLATSAADDTKQPTLAGKLTITGSSTVAPLVAEIGKRFEQLHPGVRIDVQTGGSSRGIADARSGLADIGMASRDLKSDETDIKGHVIARDGIGMIVNAANPVQSLTDAHIIDIYLGKVTNWKDVGGSDMAISVVNKAEGRSTLELFAQHYKLKNSDIKASVIIGDNQQGIKTVSGNPGAIGYVSIGTAEFEAGQGTPIKLLPLGTVAATVENVQNASFPLSRSLTLVTKDEAKDLPKAFIDFARSKDVHDLVKEQFFVPLAE